jgi:hypothetical protein
VNGKREENGRDDVMSDFDGEFADAFTAEYLYEPFGGGSAPFGRREG